jgi:hypothetical protein
VNQIQQLNDRRHLPDPIRLVRMVKLRGSPPLARIIHEGAL